MSGEGKEKIDKSLDDIIGGEKKGPTSGPDAVCFNCQKPGHIARGCTAPGGGGGRGGGGRGRGRGGPVAAQPCFNCGRAGHLARDCRAPQARVGRGAGAAPLAFAPRAPAYAFAAPAAAAGPPQCFNCGRKGHLARDCGAPSTKEGQCYNCGSAEHIVRDCTVPKKSEEESECYNCKETGHYARDCPQEKKSSSAGGGGGGGGGAAATRGDPECYHCHQTGHLARDCPAPKPAAEATALCYTCNKKGHYARDCKTPRAAPVMVSVGRGAGGVGDGCYNCGGVGHFARECVVSAARVAAALSSAAAPAGQVCYNCQRPGHIARDCTGTPRGRDGGLERSEGRRRHRSRSPGSDRGGYGGPRGRSVSRERVAVRGATGRVFVGNLAYSTTWQSLKDHMRKTGVVIRSDILAAPGPGGKSRGCGVIEYETESEAADAIRTLNDSELDGRQIFVREDREDRGFGGSDR